MEGDDRWWVVVKLLLFCLLINFGVLGVIFGGVCLFVWIENRVDVCMFCFVFIRFCLVVKLLLLCGFLVFDFLGKLFEEVDCFFVFFDRLLVFL